MKKIAKTNSLSKQDRIAATRFLIVTFSHSNSPAFRIASDLAPSADFFKKDDKKGLFFCGFKKSKRSLEKAHVLLKHVREWKGTNCFVAGKKRLGWEVLAWLGCYLKALECENKKAHCTTAADILGGGIAIVSCKLAVNHACFEYGKYDPAMLESKKWFIDAKIKFEDQLQAWAVNTGCDICPLFKSEVGIDRRPKLTARDQNDYVEIKKDS